MSGVEFFRSRQNRGRQKVKLWTSHGVLLGTGTYRGHRTGWVTAPLRRPVSISAHTRYVASYFAPHGGYSRTRKAGFPVKAHGLAARRGLRSRGRGMPRHASRTNYFVDVVFTPTPQTTPPTPTPGGQRSAASNCAVGGWAYLLESVPQGCSIRLGSAGLLPHQRVPRESPSTRPR
ncbi:DUF4082 domain-containing protein [Nocardioides sp. B-3]|uniref:DUF4082 domain-containing protein n=1 Tax=Nocardioides sp. B-3 TaxID=2895565 RepID=UPI003FA52FDD